MSPGIIFGNRVLDVVFVAWFIAQFYKVISSIFIEKRLNIRRMWETGGMPSSHSSTVSCLTTCIGIRYGTSSDLFAISIILSGIVMYDATGIRRAAGKQAGVRSWAIAGAGAGEWEWAGAGEGADKNQQVGCNSWVGTLVDF